MSINEELARAFGSHTLWKTRIERAAESGRSEFLPDDVRKENLCTFGKWLNDAALPENVRQSDHYRRVKALHAEFHVAAGNAIDQALAGQAQAARTDLREGRYYTAAQRFYNGVFDWQRAVAVRMTGNSIPPLGAALHYFARHLGLRISMAMALPLLLALFCLITLHRQAATSALLTLDLLFALLASASLAVGLLLTRSVTRPLGLIIDATRQLAKGELGVVLPAMDRADQFGELARAVLVFQEQSIAVDRIAGVREKERERSEQERREALRRMAENIEGQTSATVGRIADESEQIYETAKSMAKGAQDVEENAQMVAAAAEQSLINAEKVAAATTQLSESIQQIASQMERSRLVVGDAVDAANNASQTVDSLSQAMAAIDQVVQLIAEIASQTNLLALNATIEAARAGDAGKGFAVVANEVKNLANQTARQTSEISQRIAHLNDMAGRVIAAIRSTVGKVQDVEQIASAVAKSVQEQHQATDQISRNVVQSSNAARDVADRIVEVADEAVNTGRQAGDVEKRLRGMAEQVGELGRILTHTVRTSTPEVNRRNAPRFEISAPAELKSLSGVHQGELRDISATGARLAGVPSLERGQEAVLKIDHIDVPVSVVDSCNGICRVRVVGERPPQLEQWITQNAARH